MHTGTTCEKVPATFGPGAQGEAEFIRNLEANGRIRAQVNEIYLSKMQSAKNYEKNFKESAKQTGRPTRL